MLRGLSSHRSQALSNIPRAAAITMAASKLPVSSSGTDAPNRTTFGPRDVIREVWLGLGLPSRSLDSLQLPGEDSHGPALPSSFKIGILAQSCIALSALAAAQVHAVRNSKERVPTVTVDRDRAAIEFNSEKLYVLHNHEPSPKKDAIGGLHKTIDGHVRVHDGFPNHVRGMLDLLKLPPDASRAQVAEALESWASIDVEDAATVRGKMAAYALRSYQEWDALPQSKAISNFPIDLKQLAAGPERPSTRLEPGASRCLQGLRVVEMSRVIASPLCGKTLAVHGADVLWVTSPNLPDLPALDREFGRGKRTIQLDIHKPEDKSRLLELIRTCDVFVQGYRPSSLAAYGLSPAELAEANPDIVIANLSAFGPRGPWSQRRGFDSLVQTCSGMNVSDGEHAGEGQGARPMPCQALDHGAGYMLATGIMAALHQRAVKGGSWQVDVSLAGVMKYLRSLGQYPDSTGFRCDGVDRPEDVPEEFFETNETGFGTMTTLRHCADIEGCQVGWQIMPKPLGSDKPEWSA